MLDTTFDPWMVRFAPGKEPLLRYKVIAVGNAADHVHVLIDLGSQAQLATIAQALKGGSSHDWNLRPEVARLKRQDGYWAESVDPDALAPLARYICSQRAHHTASSRPERWESAF